MWSRAWPTHHASVAVNERGVCACVCISRVSWLISESAYHVSHSLDVDFNGSAGRRLLLLVTGTARRNTRGCQRSRRIGAGLVVRLQRCHRAERTRSTEQRRAVCWSAKIERRRDRVKIVRDSNELQTHFAQVNCYHRNRVYQPCHSWVLAIKL